jgi:taurine dioxygenase
MAAGGGTNMPIEVQKSGAPLGAEIAGVDLSKPVDEATFRAVEAAFLENQVVVLRGQRLTEEQHIAFSRRFGELEIHVLKQYLHPRHEEILLISNVIEDGKPIGIADAGQYWHTDLSYVAAPSRCSLLYALEVPVENGETKGDTLFASAVAAYEALPEAMKRRLAPLRAIHRYGDRYERMKKTGGIRVELSDEQRQRVPDVTHPVVRTHPKTGRKSLYVNEGFTAGIADMPEEESRVLLAELFEHVKKPEFIYRHKWQVGDLLMWDNCSVQHLAVADYALPLRRRMHRTTVRGTVPF